MPKLMQKTFWVWVLLLLLFLIVSYLLFYFLSVKASKSPIWDIKRNIRYNFTLENKSSEALKGVFFKTYSPLTISSSQKLVKLESNRKYIKKIDRFGNQEMLYEIDFIPPYGKARISITAGLLLSNVVAGTNSEDELFLSSQPLIETNSITIKKFANSFKENRKEIHRNIFDWLENNINYSGYGMRDKGALYALENLQGDCTEYAYLNVAINRVLGYPSRAVNGYVIDHDVKLNPTEYHTWSEVWLDGGWQVIDAQKKEFMNNQQNYIAMNVVTDTTKNKTKYKRFWVSDPNLIVTMK